MLIIFLKHIFTYMKKSNKQVSVNELIAIAKEQLDYCTSMTVIAQSKKQINEVLSGFSHVILLYTIIIRKDPLFVSDLLHAMLDYADYQIYLCQFEEADQTLIQGLAIFFEKVPAPTIPPNYEDKSEKDYEYIKSQLINMLEKSRRLRSDKTALTAVKRQKPNIDREVAEAVNSLVMIDFSEKH